LSIDTLDFIIATRLILAVLLCGAVGLERELSKGKGYAGLRTHMLVGMGSALITMVGIFAFPLIISDGIPDSDPTRIAAGIITGIGFLGAGTIMSSEEKIKGLTTAASLWVVAGIGLSIGAGFIAGSVLATSLSILILQLGRIGRIH
jgi:putative Mg2+ transporter-C (MgtC) family protein